MSGAGLSQLAGNVFNAVKSVTRLCVTIFPRASHLNRSLIFFRVIRDSGVSSLPEFVFDSLTLLRTL